MGALWPGQSTRGAGAAALRRGRRCHLGRLAERRGRSGVAASEPVNIDAGGWCCAALARLTPSSGRCSCSRFFEDRSGPEPRRSSAARSAR